MHAWSKHMEMKELLRAGLTKSAAAKRLGVAIRTVSRWQTESEPMGRKRRRHKLDPYQVLIRRGLERYPELTAQRLYEEVREAGYDGCYSRVRDYLREVRPPPIRFETAPGHQGQVDFGTFRTPWGRRYALVVVLGYSRLSGWSFSRRRRWRR